ncbi:hypothetical protein H8356DRAFT_1071141 [Neocallimastix lanati (nom. inval.)]|nr:hypothetical protein H8356DRAFT_1071141 [Neocallimastix sp. JGI-2020a]
MENFKDRVPSFQKQKSTNFDSVKDTSESKDDFSDAESTQRGAMRAIYDYLIDEASPSKIPLVCGLIDDLINEGVSNKETILSLVINNNNNNNNNNKNNINLNSKLQLHSNELQELHKSKITISNNKKWPINDYKTDENHEIK